MMAHLPLLCNQNRITLNDFLSVLQPDVAIFSLGAAIPISWLWTRLASALQRELISRLKWLKTRLYLRMSVTLFIFILVSFRTSRDFRILLRS